MEWWIVFWGQVETEMKLLKILNSCGSMAFAGLRKCEFAFFCWAAKCFGWKGGPRIILHNQTKSRSGRRIVNKNIPRYDSWSNITGDRQENNWIGIQNKTQTWQRENSGKNFPQPDDKKECCVYVKNLCANKKNPHPFRLNRENEDLCSIWKCAMLGEKNATRLDPFFHNKKAFAKRGGGVGEFFRLLTHIPAVWCICIRQDPQALRGIFSSTEILFFCCRFYFVLNWDVHKFIRITGFSLNV